MKTLQDAAKELETSLERYAKAKKNFLRAYEDSIRPERYVGDNYFQSKFGEKLTRWDYTQE